MEPYGFREIAHTADWELEAWAPDLAGLLEQAARGMYALAGARLADGLRLQRRLALDAPDRESLLVAFLSELLWLGESQALAFDGFRLDITHPAGAGLQLSAALNGAGLAAIEKEIKAVTWHRLAIQDANQGLRVRIVFDV
ncbi:MAG: archease [Chloroflexota bacterium]